MLLVCKEIVGIKYIGIRFNRKETFLAGVSPCRHTRKLALTRCRGVRRMHLRSNAPACVQAPGSHLQFICAWLIAARKISVCQTAHF